MIEKSFYSINNQNCVIALGFFDAVHIGHQMVIKECVEMAKELNAQSIVFTFKDNPADYFNKDEKLICSYSERIQRFSNLGVDVTLYAPCEERFFSMTCDEFLSRLVSDLKVVGIACGYDYTFGLNGLGNVDTLADFCAKNNIKLKVVDKIVSLGDKISSRNIRNYIEHGEIELANQLLGRRYSLSGVVVKGRGDGTKKVFPTVNFAYPNNKQIPKVGVYATKTIIDGKSYCSVTNVGAHPTFDDYFENVETYVIDFDGNLYEKNITVEFIKFLRDISKFDSADALKNQITKDVLSAREL